ncbi:von Willebrand factor A domain-containing protein 7-like [Saccostrea echinata]|uniref:von Willebrand factor A domain-containing protein 7-like n=1 Tax=Saccostrea echinata TaxID=191078 RepID=UPI002A7F356D|nr:von Willebrand factor A domain-containing protein 7-like [Saccostrea echinata]
MRFHTVLSWIMVSLLMGVKAFYPNVLVPFLSNEDYTHETITEQGVLQVFQELWNQSFSGFSRQNSRGPLPQHTVREIVNFINDIHRKHLSKPEWHFSNENIIEANHKLKRYRQLVLDLLGLSVPDYTAARKYVSYCLHLLQSFYSNTNWIELNGQTIYTDLGLPGKQLLPVATTDMNTCLSCSTQEDLDGCADNLIDNGMVLTSGYRSEIDSSSGTVTEMEVKSGKCSHGGPYSSSTDHTVRGGINKETTDPQYSPHYSLHKDAALAAIEHTRYFFNDKENGLIKHIGLWKLKNLLETIKEQTLIFVIDTSPDMKREVESIKKVIQAAVQDMMSSRTSYHFMLVTVGKVVSSIQMENYANLFGVLKAVDNITYESQQNCHKPILHTIQKVSDVAPRSSRMFVFTDSSPDKKSFHKNEIEAKKIVINFYLMGSCHRRITSFRQNLYNRYGKDTRRGRSAFTVPLSFRQIASNSGGQIYTGSASLNLLNIASSLDPEVKILKLDFPGGQEGFSTLTIPSDVTVTKLIIQIDGITTLPSARLKDQYGNLLIAGSNGQTNVTETDTGTTTIKEIINPKPGLYSLEKNIYIFWKVEVKAVSELDFTAQLMKSDANSYALTEIEGRPLVGDNVTVLVTVTLPDNVTGVSDLVLLDEKGTTLTNSKLQPYPGRKIGVYHCNVIVPSLDFQIAISGEDGLATHFRRLHTKLISPVLVKLEILPFPNPLYTGRNFIIQYTITNQGAGIAEIVATIKDSQQFGVSPFNRTHQLAAGANVTDMFVLHGGSTPGITTFVTVTAEPITSGNSNFQYSTFSLTTEDPSNKTPDTTPPDCNITKVSGSCSSVTQCDCNMTLITTELEIFDVGEGIKTISYGGAGGTAVNFSYDPFIAGLVLSQGTVKAKLVADCCRVSEDITLADWKSTSKCNVPINPSWTPGTCTTTPPPTTTTDATSISMTTDSLTTDSLTTKSTTRNGQTSGSASNTASSQPNTSVSHTTGKSTTTSTTTSVLNFKRSSNESETGLSTTWKIVIATTATAVSVAALFTGGILLRKKFTAVSPD